MATVKATFLLPLKDNDGRELLAEIDAVEVELWTVFEAYTDEGPVKGHYKMKDGGKATDINEKYVLILDDSLLSKIEEVLVSFKRKTLQEAIYLEIQGGVELRLL